MTVCHSKVFVCGAIALSLKCKQLFDVQRPILFYRSPSAPPPLPVGRYYRQNYQEANTMLCRRACHVLH